MQEGHKTLHT